MALFLSLLGFLFAFFLSVNTVPRLHVFNLRLLLIAIKPGKCLKEEE